MGVGVRGVEVGKISACLSNWRKFGNWVNTALLIRLANGKKEAKTGITEGSKAKVNKVGGMD